MAVCHLCNIQKIQKQPSCRKSVQPPLRKKMWNPKWWPRNGCDGRLIAKILITTIQVNLVSNPSETWRRQHKFELSVLNFLLLTYSTITAISWPPPWISHLFQNGLLRGRTLFLHLGCFRIRLNVKLQKSKWIKYLSQWIAFDVVGY